MAYTTSRKTSIANNQIKLIRKSNRLVEARYKFDIWETRVFIKMMSMIRPDDKEFQQYRINVTDIINEFQLPNNGNYYTQLKQGAGKLLSKQVELEKFDEKGKRKRVLVNLISSSESYVDEADGNDIILKFDPELKQHLLDLKEQYLTYDVSNILKLTSVNSIRIYELLKQYEGMMGGKGFFSRKFELIELKETLGIPKTEYLKYGHFKSKVILKAQKDMLEDTDLRFDLEETKRGRKVVAVTFIVYPNRKEKKLLIINESENPEDHPEFERIYNKVKAFVGKSTVSKWFEELSINQIKAGVSYAISRFEEGKVKDMPAYLQAMVREKTIFDQMEQKSAQEEQKRNRQASKLQEKEQLEKFERLSSDLKRKYFEEQRDIINSILSNDASIPSVLLKALKSDLTNQGFNVMSSIAYEKYEKIRGERKDTRQAFFEAYENEPSFSGFVSAKLTKMFKENFVELKADYTRKANDIGLKEWKID